MADVSVKVSKNESSKISEFLNLMFKKYCSAPVHNSIVVYHIVNDYYLPVETLSSNGRVGN